MELALRRKHGIELKRFLWQCWEPEVRGRFQREFQQSLEPSSCVSGGCGETIQGMMTRPCLTVATPLGKWQGPDREMLRPSAVMRKTGSPPWTHSTSRRTTTRYSYCLDNFMATPASSFRRTMTCWQDVSSSPCRDAGLPALPHPGEAVHGAVCCAGPIQTAGKEVHFWKKALRTFSGSELSGCSSRAFLRTCKVHSGYDARKQCGPDSKMHNAQIRACEKSQMGLQALPCAEQKKTQTLPDQAWSKHKASIAECFSPTEGDPEE